MLEGVTECQQLTVGAGCEPAISRLLASCATNYAPDVPIQRDRYR